MPKIDQTVINFSVYEDANEYYGMASVTLPDVTNQSNSISGAGISGNIDVVTLGHVDAMTLTLNFRTVTNSAFRLAEPRRHTIDLRAAQQVEDTVTGRIETVAVKHILIITPKKIGMGKVAPSSPADVSGEYAVTYFATYLDGVKKMEIDPLNSIYVINGVDYLAAVRKALGK